MRARAELACGAAADVRPADGLDAVLARAVLRRQARSRPARLDRMVTSTGAEGEEPLLAATQTDKEIALTLAEHLVAADPFDQKLGREYVAMEILAQMKSLRPLIDPMIEAPERVPVSSVTALASKAIRAARPPILSQLNADDLRHAVWFVVAKQEHELGLGYDRWGLRGDTLRWHEETSADPLRAHYAALDQFMGPNMLWRFTSRPSSELIKIDPGVSFETIVTLIGLHSGGNNKDDPRVRTLSFGRNLAALIGTAHSKGGDPGVASIAVRAEYLYGVDIASLRGKGITAHPAETRLISLFESEYVLVATPGDPPRTLEQLATVKLANPFKGDPALRGTPEEKPLFPGKQLSPLKSDAPAPDQPSLGLTTVPDNVVKAILAYAGRVIRAANELSGSVMNKEFARGDDMERSMRLYLQYIEHGTSPGGFGSPGGQGMFGPPPGRRTPSATGTGKK